jgi:hypothetical protein
MLDRDAIKRRYLYALATSPATLFPFLTGLTVAAVSAMSNAKWTGQGIFLGAAACLVSGGIFLSRLLLGNERIADKAASEIADEILGSRDRDLDELERQLSSDDDDRDNQALTELRELMHSVDALSRKLDGETYAKLQQSASAMFDVCVGLLKKNLDILGQIQTARSPAQRKQLNKDREDCLKNVRDSVKHLRDVVTELSDIRRGAADDAPELVRIRDSLDETLRIARQVETDRQDLERPRDRDRVR